MIRVATTTKIITKYEIILTNMILKLSRVELKTRIWKSIFYSIFYKYLENLKNNTVYLVILFENLSNNLILL